MAIDEVFLPNAPAQPESRLANIVNDEFDPHSGPEDLEDINEVVESVEPVKEIGYVPDSENVVTPDVAVVHQMRMRGAGEYKKARRFYADVPFVMALLLFLIALIAAASFYVSFSGLFAAASWAVGDVPPLQIAAPLMLDLSILAYSLSLFIKRERGERVWGTWLAISIFATISATANVLHTLAVSTATNTSELLIGATISGGAPILLAFATETIAKLVFSPVKK